MRVDVSQSVYHEADGVAAEFTRPELRRARYMLRRLRFLEQQVRQTGGVTNPSGKGGAVHAEWEMEALEWLLTEVGFLSEEREIRASTNR